jgi:hypothetical protein
MEIEKISSCWDATINQYCSLLELNEGVESESHKDQAENIALVLKDIFEYLVTMAKIRDKWTYKWHKTKNGISTYAYSTTQKHEYTLGMYGQEIYLESHILEAKNIKYMPNEFWATVSNLSLIKNFEFQDNAGLPKTISFDTKNGKASTYRLIRNFILLEEHQPTSTTDLGWFESRWDISEPLDEILTSGIQIIRGIHKLNYFLYRCEYQKQRVKA